MASLAYRPAVDLSLLSCLFLLLIPFSSASGIRLPSESQKVSLDLYFESLCPYSAEFIVKDLVKVFDDDLISIVHLRLFPWGNAKLTGKDTFTCQHGSTECLLNTVEACIIDVWPETKDYFPLIYCIEKLVYQRKYSGWESCFSNLGSKAKIVKDCYSGEVGKKLELQYAAATDALKPPHEYVPWVVVNGKPLKDDYDKFESEVCKAYNGTLPKACTKEVLQLDI